MGEPSLDRGESLSKADKGVPPFVGRTQELALLERWLKDAVAGHPRVVLVQGDAGIGKTRLLQEVMSIARRLRMEICLGRSYEDFTLPYLPFVEGLLPQVERVSEDIRESLGGDLQVIGQLLRRPASLRPEIRPSIAGPPDHEKLQLFLAVGHATVKFAQNRPMLFVVEDLHWADRLSLDLFDHVAFAVVDAATKEPVPLIIIGTHRQLPAEERLSRLSARLQREDICRTIALGGLDEPEVRELIGGLGVARPSHQLTVTVSDATHGNPLFIQEVLHHLVERDALEEQGGYVVTTAAASELKLPDHITAAIITRAQGLTDPCQKLLTLASFLGEGFPLSTLAAVSATPEDDVLGVLEEAMRQRLLRSEGRTFQFSHPLIRHALYHQASAPRRERLHKQIADSLQTLYADSGDTHVREIAYHLVRAGATAPQDVIVKFARHAADQAFAVFAWSEAAHYYEAALSAAESSHALAARERADLHYRAGLAHYYDQDVGPCQHHYNRAIEIYRLAGDVQGLARVLMERTRTQFTLATVPFGIVADIHPLEDVLALLGESEPALRGHILAVIAEAYRNGRQSEKARLRAQQALDIGRELPDDRLSAYASFALALAHINDLHVVEALEGWENALMYARRADDVVREGWALRSLPLALTLLGRLDETEAVATRACEATGRSQDWSSYSLALSHLASVAVARGDFEATERSAHDTMSMVSRSRYPWGGFRALIALACARTLRGAWAEAEDALDVLIEPGRVFEDAGSVIQTFARVFRQLIRADAGSADGPLDSLADDLMKAVGTDTYSVAPLCALVELASHAGSAAVARLPHEALSIAAERGVVFSSGWMFVIPRILGGVAAVEQRWQAADAHFQTAVDVATRVGARPELGRTYLDHARMLYREDADRNRARAADLVGRAFGIFTDLGMQPSVRRSMQLADALGIRLPDGPPRLGPYPDNLTEREADILVRMAKGHSRQKIAGDLVLGQRTLGRHVASILDKIRVPDEAAAMEYALEQGLVSLSTRGRAPSVADGTGEARTLRTILVTDVVASTALIRRAGDTKAHDLLRTHNMLIRQCVAAHQGVEVVHTGDGIEASFSSASAAVEAAVAIQHAFARHNREHRSDAMQVRIGINAGEPIPTEGRLFGAAVHAAFRICERALPGQILLSDVVHQLVAGKGFKLVGRGRVDLKGLGRVRVYAVAWEENGAR
jgi:class 3 adenylate cyclase/tetratricopeptide (TPR) repeat protein